jgi:hypothetical protein
MFVLQMAVLIVHSPVMACWNVGWSMSISPSVLLLGAGCVTVIELPTFVVPGLAVAGVVVEYNFHAVTRQGTRL